MNKSAPVVLGTAVALSVFAQINAPASVTNLVTAHPDFRRVNGQLYNVRKSVLWQSLSGTCASVATGGIVLQTFRTNNVYQQYSVPASGNPGAYSYDGGLRRRLVSSEVIPEKRVFIKHYASVQGPAVGQRITAVAMRTGTVEVGGDVLECWDFGTPNVVAVVTTNRASTGPRANSQRQDAVDTLKRP